MSGAGRLTGRQPCRQGLLDDRAALQQLQRQILTGQQSPATPPSATANRALPAELPADTNWFTGRDSYLEQLDRLLDTGGDTAATLAAIYGAAGVGKTALALHWAHRVRHSFPDGQLYVNLRGWSPGPPVPPRAALTRFLHALGIAPERIPTDLDEASALYRSLVAGRRLLDDIYRPIGTQPRRIAFAEQEDAMVGLVESGSGISLIRDSVLDRITRKRDFVVADQVRLTCDLSFACLTSRRHEPIVGRAFAAMQAVWDLQPDETAPAPIETARSRKSARR